MNTLSTHRLRRTCLCLALMMPGARATSVDIDVANRFDEHVEAGLPAVMSVQHRSAHADADDERAASLTVTHRLPVDVTFSDGTTHAMYGGLLDGRDVVLTRSGDHIDVGDGEHASTKLSGIDAPIASPRVARSVDDGPTEGVRTLNVHFFVHDNLRGKHTIDDIHADYVAWWLKDMSTSVLPSMRIAAHYHQSEKPEAITSHYYAAPRDVTSMDMRNARALDVVAEAARAAIDQMDGGDAELQKFVLLTAGTLPSGVRGTAHQGGSAAIASLDGSYRDVAHELGHLLGADHEGSAVLYRGGWWCESNMYPYTSGLRSKCYAYTKENERRIRSHMIGGADSQPDEPVVVDG